jgi:signal transduction histidine kinase
MNPPMGSVLVIDDDVNVLRAVGRLPHESPFRLHCCLTTEEGRQVLARNEIEVALVDQHLGPGQPTGLAFLAELRDRDVDCFRIIFTGAADLDFAVSAINQGLIDAFLVKPWSPEQLAALLNQGFETALLRRHNRQLVRELAERNNALQQLNQQLERMVAERTASLRETLARLQQQQLELVRLETQSTVTQIARGLAHELNNPLASILGYAQRLQRKLTSDEDSTNRLGVILSEVERCRGLIDQLRNLATPLDERTVPCRPGDLLASARERLVQVGLAAPLCRVDSPVPEVVAAPRSLTQVFEQVLDNARLAGATLCQLTATTDGERISLSLANDGATPSDEEIRNAARPFFTTHAHAGHRGLGLAIASALLREQGGHIVLDLRRDGRPGAEVMIMLPASTARLAAPAPTTPGRAAGNGVLVVDDDPMLAELIGDCLGDLGISAQVVATPEQARAAVDAGGVRAVIADYHLEGSSGVDLLRDLIARAPALLGHVAVFTGASDQRTLEQIRHAANCPVMVKPFRLDQLQQLIKDLL